MTTIKAGKLYDGVCFRKEGGSVVYRKISDNAAKYYGIGSSIYGVAVNGNMTRVAHDKIVVICQPPELLDSPPAPESGRPQDSSNRNDTEPFGDPCNNMSAGDAIARYRSLFRAIQERVKENTRNTPQKTKCQQLGDITKMVNDLLKTPDRRSKVRDRRGH